MDLKHVLYNEKKKARNQKGGKDREAAKEGEDLNV
jgi:hypothetical protein